MVVVARAEGHGGEARGVCVRRRRRAERTARAAGRREVVGEASDGARWWWWQQQWLVLAEEVDAVGHQGDEGELDDEAAMVAGVRGREEGGEQEVAGRGEHLTRGEGGDRGRACRQRCSTRTAASEDGLAGRSGGGVAGRGEVEEVGGSRKVKGARARR